MTEPIVAPTSSQSLPKQAQVTAPKKKRRWWPLVLWLVILMIPLGFLGWTGLWNIPVVSAVFGTNKPIDLGVKVSAEDLASAKRDNPMTFVGDAGSWYGLSVKKYTGTVPVDDHHSSAEVTSFIHEYSQASKYVKKIQVKFHPGGLEVSAMVVPIIHAPVYADVAVTRTSPTSVSVTLTKAKIGRLTLPAKYYDQVSQKATEWINARLAEVTGLSIDSLEYAEDSAYLKGTLPKTVEQVPSQEYKILGKFPRDL